jgi:hypothetical protein
MPSSQAQPDPLRPVLEETEAELAQHLETTRERTPEDVSAESEEELRALEDSLLAAAVAVQQTLSLRRHVEKREAAAAAKEREETERKDAAERREAAAGVREFHDRTGKSWRAWSVVPGLRPGRDAKRYLGEYHGGWLCFEALDGSCRRRLPRYPTDWMNLDEPALDQLLGEAINAPERRKSTAAPGETAPGPPANP